MNRQVQAAMRSGLLFPGAGQLFLGRRWRALAFALPTLAAAVTILSDIMPPIQAVAERLALEMLDGRTPDLGELLAKVHQLSLGVAASSNLAVYALVGMWAASIIDAWLLAR